MYSPPSRPLEKKEMGLVFHLLSLSRWSPHLPQCQSTASSSVSVTVQRVVIPTAPLNESIVNGYRRIAVNIHVPAHLLPQWMNPNLQVNTDVSSVTTTTSSRDSLSELNATVHVLFSASTRPTGQLEGRGLFWGLAIGRLLAVVTACTCCTLIACQLHDGSLLCLFTVCSTGSIRVLDPRRVPETQCYSCHVYDGGAMLPADSGW